MCGINGQFNFKGPISNIELSKLEISLVKIKHRGPDARGRYLNKNVFLGHNRLSIIDLQETSNQPFHYKDLVLVFNGEIYNYIELREELINLGYTFRTKSDTEVLIKSYHCWKNKCLHKLRGMWAFAIYNSTTKELLLSRDRFGIKPLYYYLDKEKIIFCSEIKGIIPCLKTVKPNLEIVANYFLTGLTDYSDKTCFEKISQLLPSQNLVISVEEIKFEKYYSLPSNSEPYNDSILIETLDLHLRSDVKIGTSLSGGVDSSLIASYTKSKLDQADFTAITSDPIPKIKSEYKFAKTVCDYSNIRLKSSEPTPETFVKDIFDFVYTLEEPTISSSPYLQYKVMEKAASENIKVMLDGQGGDEAFLGYERYYVSQLLNNLISLNLKEFIKNYNKICKNSKLNKISLFAYLLYFGTPGLKKIITAIRYRNIKTQYILSFFSNIKFPSFFNLRELRENEFFNNQLPHLLRYEDRNSMAFSIEARVPFVDHKLIESTTGNYSLSSFKDGFTKVDLRKFLERYSVKEIAWRKDKFGFEPPEDKWLNQISEKDYNEAIENSKILKLILNRRNSNNRNWREYNIAIWEKVFFKKGKYE